VLARYPLRWCAATSAPEHATHRREGRTSEPSNSLLLGVGCARVRALHGTGSAVVLAQDEARGLKHNYIGTEHILLDLLPYEPQSPPLAPEFAPELERVRAAKEEAIEAKTYELAASLRDRERKLFHAVTPAGACLGGPTRPTAGTRLPAHVPAHGRLDSRSRSTRAREGHLLRLMLFAVALGVGLLVGRLIWG
jgi:hypothetical protein